MGIGATRRLHNDAFRNMMRSPMSFFNLTPIGKTLNTFAKDMDDCDDMLHDNIYMVSGLFTTHACAINFISLACTQR